MISYPLPVLGFCAYSGTGKTTLLKQLLPILKLKGLRVGVVKHAHHQFDIDHPGKDSHELRRSGASQMLVTSRKRMAWVKELTEDSPEPDLQETLGVLDEDELDLVLVEGFKQTAFPKIELHRPVLEKPLLHHTIPGIIAIATDTPLPDTDTLPPQLDLNDPLAIADFIIQHILPASGSMGLTSFTKDAGHAH